MKILLIGPVYNANAFNTCCKAPASEDVWFSVSALVNTKPSGSKVVVVDHAVVEPVETGVGISKFFRLAITDVMPFWND